MFQRKKTYTEVLNVVSKNIAKPMTFDLNCVLVDSVWECIRKITSSMFVLSNSFFTVSDKNLIVLKTFVNKNTDKKLMKYIHNNGTSLDEKVIGNNATYIAYKSGKISFLKGKHIIKGIDCISIPIRFKNNIVGYLSLSTIATNNVELLSLFIQSIAINIENNIILSSTTDKISKYLEALTSSSSNSNKLAFSEKENVIAEYLKLSYSNEKIASDLFVSEATVKTYLKRIYDKCGTNNRTDTAIYLLCSEFLEHLKSIGN